MARTINYDPGTSEARSSWIVGLTEACNKLSGVLDMQTGTLVDEPLPELYISEDDRYRIYQVGVGKKLWLSDPVPVIKKNGTAITESTDGFEIDCIGGSVAFEESKRLAASDTLTVSATYIVDQSNTINDILSQISDLADETERYKGNFSTVADLRNKYATGTAGDFAVITSDNAFYTWSATDKDWVIVHSELKPQGTAEDSDWYYYGGRNSWQDLKTKVLGCILTGLDTSTVAKVEATDTLLTAFGKLQAQINDGTLGLKGEGAPTTQTVGKIGQDYIDTAAGKKYHLVSIDVSGGTQQYIWEQYANISDLPTLDSTPTSGSENGVTSGGVYTALQNAQTTADGKYMTIENPTGTGSFSMNRMPDSQIGEYSSTLGADNTASGVGSHAEGATTIASGNCAHAEGEGTVASGDNSHAEGATTTASGANAHAEGVGTVASGRATHAEGYDSEALGLGSHAEGRYTIARKNAQHTQGKYNIEDTDTSSVYGAHAHIVGNGTSDGARSNAHTLSWDGTAWFQGDVYVGSTSGTNKDDGSEKLAKVSELPTTLADLTGTLPVSQGGTGATTTPQARTNLGAQAQHKTTTVTLASGATSWSPTATGVTTTNTVIVCPADSSRDAYMAAGVLCTAQASNKLTFTATSAPTEDLTVNIVILD